MSNSTPELWRPVVGLESTHLVSNLGKIKIISSGKIVKQSDDGRGYRSVNLWANKKGHPRRVHRVVAMAWIENPDDLPEVNHINFNKADNRKSNLEWVSSKGNTEHSLKAGYFTATNNPKRRVKLSLEDVTEIRRLHSEGATYAELGRRFNVKGTTIRRTVLGITWFDPTKGETASQIKTRKTYEVDGQTHTLYEWASIRGMNPKTIQARLHKGWSPTDAILQPVGRNNSVKFSKQMKERGAKYRAEMDAKTKAA